MAKNTTLLTSSVSVVGFAYAIYGFYSPGRLGDALFSAAIASGALVETAVRNPDLYIYRAVERLRHFFQHGAGIARALIIAITVGGTLLAIDIPYDISFIPQAIDPVIKRGAPVLVVAAIVFYVANIVSNAIFETSVERRDQTLRRYEIFYYLSALLLIASFAILMAGVPVEHLVDSATSAVSGQARNDRLLYPVWPVTPWALIVVVLVSFVWACGSFFCIVSRQTEWFFGRIVAPRVAPEPSTPDATRL